MQGGPAFVVIRLSPPVPSAPTTTADSSEQEPAGTLTSTLAGTWKGTATEHSSSSADRQWQVVLDLTAGRKNPGTMRAVDLECTSYVTVTKAGATTATLRAPMPAADNRNGTCSTLGVISMRLNAKAGPSPSSGRTPKTRPTPEPRP